MIIGYLIFSVVLLIEYLKLKKLLSSGFMETSLIDMLVSIFMAVMLIFIFYIWTLFNLEYIRESGILNGYYFKRSIIIMSLIAFYLVKLIALRIKRINRSIKVFFSITSIAIEILISILVLMDIF